MAYNLTETPISQLQQQEEDIESDDTLTLVEDSNNIADNQNETVDEILSHDALALGNWADVLAEDLPNLENGGADEQLSDQDDQPQLPVVPEVYPHKLGIVLGSDLLLCQVPERAPFNLLVFELPDNVTEEELYMLFGGKIAIECHMYRRDLREIIFSFRHKGHLLEALLKENMIFKEKPLRLAVILIDYQITQMHFHNQKHKAYSLNMIPFKGAFDKCHERLEDGSLSELFGNTIIATSFVPAPLSDDEMENSVINARAIPNQIYRKPFSNDVRLSQPQYCQQTSVPSSERQRTGSITSITSSKCASEQGGTHSISRQSSYQSSEKSHHQSRNFQNQQSIERQNSAASSNTGKRVIERKNNPFGEAKPVNTQLKVLEKQEQMIAQKSAEQKTDPQLNQPPPQQIPRPSMEMVPGNFKIQKRPVGMLPPQNGQKQFTNTVYAQQHPNVRFRQQGPHQNFRHPTPSVQPTASNQQQSQHPHQLYTVGDEIIDVSRPPPSMARKQEEKKQYPQRNIRKSSNNYQDIPNGFNSNNIHQGSHNSYSSHQSLPPAPPSRRKSSTDDRAGSETIETEKSQSAPVSHETVAMSQSSPRSSPPYNSLKRPSSANSSMSYITAHSGSEMSSTVSTDLPCIRDSVDSITERLSDTADDQRRRSWEGHNSPDGKKESPRKKNSSRRGKKLGSGEIRKSTNSENVSRGSSASTPQYQSASNVFMDEGSSSEAKEKPPTNEPLPEPEQKAITKAKNGLEKRAPSLPLSRPHTSSNEKSTNPPKLDDSNKPDSLSAPPTPSGQNKKKVDKSKKDNKRGTTDSTLLRNNKFNALLNAPMGTNN